MSWVPSSPPSYSLLESLSLRALRCGSVPSHLAFIMDGNRRFAKANGLEKIDGHAQGFEKLSETLQWCNELGIKEVTVYAFR
jgi:ditrans,polycis-polyprenyl diphosphate synthase